MFFSRAFPIILVSTSLITLILAFHAQKRGIFDEFYQDDDLDILDDLSGSLDLGKNRDYEITYDTRQKGDENYRVHIDGVHVVMDSEPQGSSDLLEAIESLYGMGGGNNEEVSFIIGGASSTTTKKEGTIEPVTVAGLSESEIKENEVKKETNEVAKETTEKNDATTRKAENIDISTLKRNIDFIKKR